MISSDALYNRSFNDDDKYDNDDDDDDNYDDDMMMMMMITYLSIYLSNSLSFSLSLVDASMIGSSLRTCHC
jgi:hypothetical protein